MSSFFQFTQGTESRFRPTDTSPLLGRFRAVPPRPELEHRRSQLGLLADRYGIGNGSLHVGYGAVLAAGLADEDDEDDSVNPRAAGGEDDEISRWQRLWKRWIIDLWVEPRQGAVKRVVDRWWSRYGLLVFLPALLVRVLLVGYSSLVCCRLTDGCIDNWMVRHSIPSISSSP